MENKMTEREKQAFIYGYNEAFDDVFSSLEYLKKQNYKEYKDDKPNKVINTYIDYLRVVRDISTSGIDLAMENLKKSKENKA
ncbi:hypothetical protein [Anaerococcus hydrogenalis]|uniref:hypothetical protein n=1 Tax=Anaerococcus hydrogenalis TaxID=33029 RepID=UPI0028FF2A9C|nr:hypothetical protein [Anaerococcus hydrogenalis]MDU1316908.1 hypothetical protein [Anaerococcus hydrogenalis]